MKNSEAKKKGIFARVKTYLSELESIDHERYLKMAKQEAQRLCSQLSFWDVSATVVEEEGTSATVQIKGSPIHWIYVCYVHEPDPERFPRDYYVYEFFVPDPRPLVKLWIRAATVRKWGWITGGYWITGEKGKLIDIHWKGNEFGTGIFLDQEIKATVMGLIDDPARPKKHDSQGFDPDYLQILTRPEISSWVIKPTFADLRIYFRREHWNAFETIAKRLLMMPLPN